MGDTEFNSMFGNHLGILDLILEKMDINSCFIDVDIFTLDYSRFLGDLIDFISELLGPGVLAPTSCTCMQHSRNMLMPVGPLSGCRNSCASLQSLIRPSKNPASFPF